ncbi:MAG: GspE/PulE family protein [Patescibacteria group bacterium]
MTENNNQNTGQQAAPNAEAESSHRHTESIEEMKQQLEGNPNQISVIKLVDAIVVAAFEARASDIHVDPEGDKIRIRFRIDGVLHDNFSLPKNLQSELVTRIKILAGLRTDEHQAAQDGRFKMQVPGHDHLDVRVSIAPTYYGENCVMRLLAEQSQGLSLESLGYSVKNLEILNSSMRRPYGMILATGPTGSGKTTSLYAVLKKLNIPDVSIITIEDPIEYSIGGIDQVQVNTRTGLTFSDGLRFILRQDPNIIMVGEIRDDDTAKIAVNAAMTGHLVLSTLHTNDSATTLPRLLDMGVEPFLIASTINIAIGQRLVRKVCNDCRAERQLKPEEIVSLKGTVPDKYLNRDQTFVVGVGCKKCEGTGYKGRIGIHEVLQITEPIRKLIMQRATAAEIRRAAIAEGMVPMLEDGIEKAMSGVTTIEEVLRVFHE